MEFSRQEYWSGLLFFLQGIFPTQGFNLCLLSLLHKQTDSFNTMSPGKPFSEVMIIAMIKKLQILKLLTIFYNINTFQNTLENIPSSKSTNLEIIEFAYSLYVPHSLWCLILAIPAITSIVRVLLYSTLFHVSYWIQLTHTWLNLLIITSFILLYVQSFINIYIIKSNILALKDLLSLSEFVVQRKDLLFSYPKNSQKTKGSFFNK